MLFGRAELVFAYAAEFALEILGKVFPLNAGFLFVINPAANFAYVFHFLTSQYYWINKSIHIKRSKINTLDL